MIMGLVGGLIELICIEYEIGTWCRRSAHQVLIILIPSQTSFYLCSSLFLQIIIYYQKVVKCRQQIRSRTIIKNNYDPHRTVGIS